MSDREYAPLDVPHAYPYRQRIIEGGKQELVEVTAAPMPPKLPPWQVNRPAGWRASPPEQVLEIEAEVAPGHCLRRPIMEIPNEMEYSQVRRNSRPEHAAPLVNKLDRETRVQTIEHFAVALEVPERRRNAFTKWVIRFLEAGDALLGRRKKEALPDWIKARKRDGLKALPDFVAEKFRVELADGTMSRALWSRYKDLRRDFYSFERSNRVPDWLANMPSGSELITHQLDERAKAGRPVRTGRINMPTAESRLYDAERYRRAVHPRM